MTPVDMRVGAVIGAASSAEPPKPWLPPPAPPNPRRAQVLRDPITQLFADKLEERTGVRVPDDKLQLLADVIQHAESGISDDPQTEVNPKTSATGYYQLINDTRSTAAKSILKRMKAAKFNAPQWVHDAARTMTKEQHIAFVGNLSKQQQQVLMLNRLFESSGSLPAGGGDELWKAWAASGYQAKGLEDIYVLLHHTLPTWYGPKEKLAIRKHIQGSLKLFAFNP